MDFIVQDGIRSQLPRERASLVEIRMSKFDFVNLGLLAHVVLVWCGVRATGLTIGQAQDKYRTSIGQVWDKYRTTTGQV